MITDADRAAIADSVARRDVGQWRPLTSTEADLLKRALAAADRPPKTEDAA